MNTSLLDRVHQKAVVLVQRFCRHGSLHHAASLSFTTVLSLIPLMTVVFTLFSAFPVGQQLAENLQSFIFTNFVPVAGEVVKEHILAFMRAASSLTGANLVILIVIALMLMRNIDIALNRIWESRLKRPFGVRLLTYWALLTLGPVLLSAGLVATSYLVSLPFLKEAEQIMPYKKTLLQAMPVLSSGLAFALMYWAIPYRSVRIRHALLGGFVAAILFEMTKYAFTHYATSVVSYQAIYGALSAIPVFLLWIYICWALFLIGAELTRCLDNCEEEQTLPEAFLPRLQLYVRLLRPIYQGFGRGQKMNQNDLLQHVHLNPEFLQKSLDSLIDQDILVRDDQGHLLLARSLESMTVYDLMQNTLIGREDAITDESTLEEFKELLKKYPLCDYLEQSNQ